MLAKDINNDQMVMASYISIMLTFYKDNLKMVDVKEKLDGSKRMEVIIKEILKIMLLTAMADILMLTHINIKDSGRIIYPMVLVRLSIPMAVGIMVSSWIIKGMAKVYLLKRAKLLMAILSLIKCMVSEYYNLIMVKNIKVNGLIIRRMDMVNTHGQLAVSIKDHMKREREMEKVAWFIKMDKYMMEIGKMERNMEMVFIELETNNLMENGIKAN